MLLTVVGLHPDVLLQCVQCQTATPGTLLPRLMGSLAGALGVFWHGQHHVTATAISPWCAGTMCWPSGTVECVCHS
jgi:hypothetical protein